MSDKTNKKALGRGLETIFGSNVEQFLEDIQNNARDDISKKQVDVPVNEIRPNPYQPRKEFDEKALKELSESIRVHGIFTPLLVRKSLQGYELIAGERRLRAAKIAGLKEVPAMVVEFTDEEMMEISLLENIQRENLNAIEEATAYDSLIKRLGYTQEKLAERVGKSREHCANMLRLLKLPYNVQQMVTEKKLSMGHVRPLLTLEDEDQMYDAAKYILEQKMTVREVEEYVRQLKGIKPEKKEKKTKEKDPMVRDLESRLSSRLGTKVQISSKSMSIQFTNTEDLNRILDLLGCIEEE